MKNRSFITVIAVANLLLVLAVVNGSILKKQAIVDDGQVVLIELAPVDPRSLMQGDYMILNYALNRDQQMKSAMADAPTRGSLLLAIDDRGVGQFRLFVEQSDEDGRLAKNEVRLRYRKSQRGMKFGIESFFFQEGLADTYANAKFAEVRVAHSGEAVITGLLNARFEPLGG